MDGDKLLTRLCLAVALLAPITYVRTHKKEYKGYEFKQEHHFQCKERWLSMQPGEMKNLPNGETIMYVAGNVAITKPGHLSAIRELRGNYSTEANNVFYEMHKEKENLVLHEIDCR